MRLGLGMAACVVLAGCGGGGAKQASQAKANNPIGELRPDLKQAASSYPSDPAEVGKLVADSTDVDKHRTAFLAATGELLASKRCSAADFQAQGGWMKSAMKHAKEPVYFVYCGGALEANRVYLNAETGKLLS